MKHLIISALLAVSLFVTAPAAQAADWNNDTLSCDIKVTDTWFGMWQNFKATFYVAAKPTEIYTIYECTFIGGRNQYQYRCFVNAVGDDNCWDWNKTRVDSSDLVFYPGITQRQTCDMLFKEFHPTPK